MTFQVSNEIERRAARRILRGRGLPTSEVHRMSYAALAAALAGTDETAWRAALEYAAQSVEAARVAKDAPPPVKGRNTVADGPTAPGPKGEGKADGEGQGEGEAGEGEGEGSEAEGQAEGEAQGEGKGKGNGQGGNPPDALEARVRQIIAEAAKSAKPAVDKDAVRQIAKAEAEAAVKAADKPMRLEVILPDETVREVEGTAHYMTPEVLQVLAAKEKAWLPGPAGSGKSTLARQCLMVLGYSDPETGEPAETPKRIHMTGAIETPFQLTGYRSPNNDPATLMTPFRKAWQFGGGFIFDDVDRSNPKALAAFNEALANGHCAFPDGVVKAHPDFRCIATANTFGLGGGTDYVGAARLDKATLDRFCYVEIPYDERQEKAIAAAMDADKGPAWCARVQAVRKACKGLGLKHLVTPRATYKGIRLLQAGMSQARVESATIFAGLDAETLNRVKGAA